MPPASRCTKNSASRRSRIFARTGSSSAAGSMWVTGKYCSKQPTRSAGVGRVDGTDHPVNFRLERGRNVGVVRHRLLMMQRLFLNQGACRGRKNLDPGTITNRAEVPAAAGHGNPIPSFPEAWFDLWLDA